MTPKPYHILFLLFLCGKTISLFLKNMFFKKILKKITMRKFYYFFILLLTLVNTTIAQEQYQSFFGNNNTTYHIFSVLTCKSKDANPNLLGCGYTFDYSFNREDTIGIHQNLYYYISRGIDTMYIREDTLSGKLYRYFPVIEREELICDMSLNVGDTFQFPVIDSIYSTYSFYYREAGEIATVDSISYINGKKIIYLSPVRNSAFYTFYNNTLGIRLAFIEGVGPTYGPFGHINGYGYESNLGLLLCVDKDGTLAYMTSDTLGCFQSGAGIPEMGSNEIISIYPNPAQDQITIQILKEELSSGTLEVLNIMGSRICQVKADDEITKINIQNLSSGIYFVRYCYNQKFVISKFIKL